MDFYFHAALLHRFYLKNPKCINQILKFDFTSNVYIIRVGTAADTHKKTIRTKMKRDEEGQ